MRHIEGLEDTLAATHTVSEQVIQAIADQKGVSPLDISPPLFDAVDPDALDRLYDDGRTGVTTQFEYCGYLVTVHGDGRIDLAPVAK